MQLLLVPILT